MKVYLHMEDYQAVYIPREDLNLDVEVLKIGWARDGMTIEYRRHFDNENELLPVRLVMETFNMQSQRFEVCLEKQGNFTPKQIRQLIRHEVTKWQEYDKWFEDRIANELISQITRAKAGKKTSRAKRRLPFSGPKKKKHKASGPKVRVVTALDHANDAQDEANAALVETMTAQKTLRDEERFLETLSAKPLKVAAAIFLAATKKDLVTMAMELASHCKPDHLADVLLKNRDAALENLSTRYQLLLSEAIQANANADTVRSESYGIEEDDAFGPNVEDAADAVFGPNEVFGPNVEAAADAVFGPNEGAGDGPNEDAVFGPNEGAGDGPNKGAGDGPNEGAGDGPVDLTTPKPFVEQPHYIRSTNPRSSTGYKGIVKDSRGGWRAKGPSGKHIGRYDDKMEACQAYYEYCFNNGLIGPGR